MDALLSLASTEKIDEHVLSSSEASAAATLTKITSAAPSAPTSASSVQELVPYLAT